MESSERTIVTPNGILERPFDKNDLDKEIPLADQEMSLCPIRLLNGFKFLIVFDANGFSKGKPFNKYGRLFTLEKNIYGNIYVYDRDRVNKLNLKKKLQTIYAVLKKYKHVLRRIPTICREDAINIAKDLLKTERPGLCDNQEGLREFLYLKSIGKLCMTCGRETPSMLKCSKCGVAFYCGVDCQKKHWPIHKEACPKKVFLF